MDKRDMRRQTARILDAALLDVVEAEVDAGKDQALYLIICKQSRVLAISWVKYCYSNMQLTEQEALELVKIGLAAPEPSLLI